MITQKELKELICYDPDTGEMVSIKRRQGVPLGKRLGNALVTGHRRLMIYGKYYLEHRVAWFYMHGAWPKDQIDHINHDPSDNRICNLREASHLQNMHNQSMSKNNTSGHTGVYRDKKTQVWYVQIQYLNKVITKSGFVDFNEAVKFRKNLERQYNFHKNHGAPVMGGV